VLLSDTLFYALEHLWFEGCEWICIVLLSGVPVQDVNGSGNQWARICPRQKYVYVAVVASRQAGNILWLKWTFPHIPLEPAAPPRDKFWILQEARNFKHAVFTLGLPMLDNYT
jgi:hypothetical protein